LCAQLAEWVASLSFSDIPPEARRVAVRAFVDTAGVILAGAAEPIAEPIRRWVAERSHPAGTLVPPYRLRTTPEVAAFALGVLAHALDFDDIHPSTIGHPSTVLVPPILALGPPADASGEDAIVAYVAGAEVCAHLGRVSASQQYRRGWHTTSTLNILGGTASAARLLGLDAEQTEAALGLAASAACGLRANFGSDAKPLHAGQAAYHAVTAGLMAREGLTATRGVLDSPLGYLHALAGDPDLGEGVAAELGSRWELIDPGIQIKPYPCCGGAHRSIDALRDLVLREDLSAEEVESVVALVDPLVPTLLVHAEPTEPAEARFSLHHCLAAMLADRELSLEHFTREALRRPDLGQLRSRISCEIHPELRDHQGGLAFSEVKVTTRDGRVLRERAEEPRGSISRPLSDEELEDKFLDCARRCDRQRDWQPVLDALWGLAGDGDVASAVEAFSAVHRSKGD
jgi:2-methylcitrate dehydratase PrpD